MKVSSSIERCYLQPPSTKEFLNRKFTVQTLKPKRKVKEKETGSWVSIQSSQCHPFAGDVEPRRDDLSQIRAEDDIIHKLWMLRQEGRPEGRHQLPGGAQWRLLPALPPTARVLPPPASPLPPPTPAGEVLEVASEPGHGGTVDDNR